MNKPAPYHETLLHWLWKNRCLQNQRLTTCNGRQVQVHHPGYPNPSDGPDFINARITIGSLKWHGDVEIHWTADDWSSHSHHTDSNYNRVILHVVFNDDKPAGARRKDDTVIPTLLMKPFLSQPLQYFFKHFKQPDKLPCSGNLSSIPEQVLQAQFDQSHTAYFEQKINDLLSLYDAALPLSQAWKKMLVIALFDGLGISHNRKPMRKLAGMLLDNIESFTAATDLTSHALLISGVQSDDENANFNWKRKGSRPANHPEVRITQACRLLWSIQNQSFGWWLRTEIEAAFSAMIKQVDTEPGIGAQRGGVLFGTVWIPAFYILGDLTGTSRLRSAAKNAWANHRTPLPASISKVYDQTGFPPTVFKHKLGAVHQFRAYCKPHQCQQCKVFNHIISA